MWRGTEVFKQRAGRYDAWHEKHRAPYASELMAVQKIGYGGGVEIGVGTGRFAAPLGLKAGVDPVRETLRLAPKTLDLVEGVGGLLPIRDKAYPCALIAATLCFVEDPATVLREAARAAESRTYSAERFPWGRLYTELGARRHPFYSKAKFYTVAEVVAITRGLVPSKSPPYTPHPPDLTPRRSQSK